MASTELQGKKSVSLDVNVWNLDAYGVMEKAETCHTNMQFVEILIARNLVADLVEITSGNKAGRVRKVRMAQMR
ncbi:MAG: hypothetical protein LQ341_003002 [Variospora aurantia]|nr:MAG: hypothetical protein LQ341_003002 [Variospora aurantia]